MFECKKKSFIWLFSFTNWFNMPFQWSFREKDESQILHLSYFFSSWTFRFFLWVKLHHKYYTWMASFSQTNSICSFILVEKAQSQILHLNGFFPSWIHSLCLFRSRFWEKLASQLLHVCKGLLPFMNWFNMPIQLFVLRKSCITMMA